MKKFIPSCLSIMFCSLPLLAQTGSGSSATDPSVGSSMNTLPSTSRTMDTKTTTTQSIKKLKSTTDMGTSDSSKNASTGLKTSDQQKMEDINKESGVRSGDDMSIKSGTGTRKQSLPTP